MACKITKRIEHREPTFEEFKKQKGYGDYKVWRQAAKSLNFLTIFGGSASVFSEQALETSWNIGQVEHYLEMNDPKGIELERVKNTYKNFDESKQKYVASASIMINKFFEGYPGLKFRADEAVERASTDGYIRTPFGFKRAFAEVMLRGKDDAKFLSKQMRNHENQSKNVEMQNMESCIRGRAMRELEFWLIENGYKTFIWNEIHDSTDFFMHKKEINQILAHVKHVEERVIPELEDTWVPLIVDAEISDLTANEHNYYKGGASPETYGIPWNDNLKYEDFDPFNVELSDTLEDKYFEERNKYWKEVKKEEDPLKKEIEEYYASNKTSRKRNF